MKSEIREYRRAKRKQFHIKKRKGRLDPRTGRPGKRK
tara:strand:- start:254 stop:364 length:111 start_codon:yes stop_codon:yes gene_type:complete